MTATSKAADGTCMICRKRFLSERFGAACCRWYMCFVQRSGWWWVDLKMLWRVPVVVRCQHGLFILALFSFWSPFGHHTRQLLKMHLLILESKHSQDLNIVATPNLFFTQAKKKKKGQISKNMSCTHMHQLPNQPLYQQVTCLFDIGAIPTSLGSAWAWDAAFISVIWTWLESEVWGR